MSYEILSKKKIIFYLFLALSKQYIATYHAYHNYFRPSQLIIVKKFFFLQNF